MIIHAIKTARISAGSTTLLQLLDTYLTDVQEHSILAITSKVVSLCEHNVVSIEGTDKEALIRAESQYYMPDSKGPWNINFTVTQGLLAPSAGIDESNADGVYVLWPRDSQKTANQVRSYLQQRFGVTNVGVVITDSTVRPMRRGVSGIGLAFSGFLPLRDYRGKPDLYGRPFKVAKADIFNSVAGMAVFAMGEGDESTPLALLSDMTTVDFVDRDPTPEELQEVTIPMEDDLFAPFLQSARWTKGGKASHNNQ